MKQLRRSKFEFSKIMVRRALLILVVQLGLTMLVTFFRVEVAHALVNLMTATAPIYLVIFGGYFGKAGVENYNKIKYDNERYVEYSDEVCYTPTESDG